MITYFLICPKCKRRKRLRCSPAERGELRCVRCRGEYETDWGRQGAPGFSVKGWSPDNVRKAQEKGRKGEWNVD